VLGESMSTNSEPFLPYLLKHQAFSQSPSRRTIVRALKCIDRWRQWMYIRWRMEGESDPANAVDNLMAIVVLLHYCAPRLYEAETCMGMLRDGRSWQTVEGVAQACRETLPSLVGRILFAQDAFACIKDVPDAIRN